MPRPFGRKRTIPDETGEQLQLAAAVAAEAVVSEHVRFALQLVDEGSDRAPVGRLLDAYARLHYLTADEHRQLSERVLVALGRDPEAAARARLQAPRSVVRRVGQRLRGRVDLDLREWVDRHTAAAELAVLDIHVEHALAFVRILREHGPAEEAVSVYAETMALRPTMAEMVRLRVLATPSAPAAGQEAPDAAVEPLRPPRSRLPLRLAEDGG